MIKVGIDIGGTFTDAIAMDESTGEFWSAKLPTTYPDPSTGFIRALNKLLAQRQLTAEDVDLIIHGTTLVTNAIIERKGGPVGLITTEGFGDTLWIRTERRYDLFDVMIEFPDPLVGRPFVYEVPERVRYSGEIVTPLDEGAAMEAVRDLVDSNVSAIAICLLHSYANPKHEQRLEEMIKAHSPEMRVSLSSEVWPESGEYYRMSTTVANAYVQPVVEDYLDGLVRELEVSGFQGKFYLMLSNGGTASVETGRKFPVQLIESGPAAGVLAAIYLAKMAGFEDVLSFDMGGTTAKLSLIEKGAPLQTDLVEAARLKRHMPGSGIPIKVPVVDLLEVGSGGGSIARIDHMGLLKVGPLSAGADPGPACYGWGGEDPTVTDADLVLGYLNPSYFLGGEMALDPDAARQALARDIVEPTEMEIAEAAWGVHEVVNQNMALAAKMHVLERGHDPTRYSLIAYGGAGPAHAYGIARTLGIGKVIVPPSAGVAASLGFLAAPIAFDLLRSYRMPLPDCNWQALEAEYETLEQRGVQILQEADVAQEEISLRRSADMRFIGQGYEVLVPLPDGPLRPENADDIFASFQDAYRELYTRLPSQSEKIEFVRLRVRAWTAVNPPELPRVNGQPETAVPISRRAAYFGDVSSYVETPVFRWDLLPVEKDVVGPAIIEAVDTTVVVGPGGTFRMDQSGYLTLTLSESAS